VIQLRAHDDVTQLELSSPMSRLFRYGVSVYVVRGVMIDTGFPAIGSQLEHWLDAHPIDGAIVTHAHEDHAGNVARLARRGLPIQMAAESDAAARHPGHIGLYRRVCWGAYGALTASLEPFSHPALTLTPAAGHSADHHVVWDEERETLFCGDLFIGVKVRIAHRDEDLRAQVRVLREAAARRPRRVFDGHRGALADPVGELLAKADWIDETVHAIESRARDGWSDRAIRNDVLGREDGTGIASFGDYSRLNFVRSVVRSMR
jgi:glyoxylase-like metal-dependent hydrolase (beta-lactamase superfamily II)